MYICKTDFLTMLINFTSMNLARHPYSPCFDIQKKELTANFIIQKVCDYFYCKRHNFFSEKKYRIYVLCRQIATVIIRNEMGITYNRIANFYHKKHDAAIYYCKLHRNFINFDKNYKKHYENILQNILINSENKIKPKYIMNIFEISQLYFLPPTYVKNICNNLNKCYIHSKGIIMEGFLEEIEKKLL